MRKIRQARYVGDDDRQQAREMRLFALMLLGLVLLSFAFELGLKMGLEEGSRPLSKAGYSELDRELPAACRREVVASWYR